MIRMIVFVLLLAALAAGGAWLAEQPGEITLVVDQWRIDASLGMGVVVLLSTAILVALLWSIARFLFRLPSLMSLAARTRRRARGFSAISRGMIAVGAGDPQAARRSAADAQKLLGEEPLTLLLRAQSAQMDGRRADAEKAFRAMLDTPETRVLGLRGLFIEARRKGDAAAARAYVAEATRLAPGVTWAAEAALEHECAEGRWQDALATLKRSKGFDKEELRRKRAVLLTADAMEKADRRPDDALNEALEAIKLAPDLVPAHALAIRLTAQRGDLRKATKRAEAAWRECPHPDIADAAMSVRSGDSARDKLQRAEKLAALAPSHFESRMIVARAAIAARDFTRARELTKALIDEGATVSVCLVMADLEEAENGRSGRVREWLARAARAPRDAAWIADGVISEDWRPVSPIDGTLDAFRWGRPAETIAHHPADIVPPPDAEDAVLADLDEPEATPLSAPIAASTAPTPRPKAEADALTAPPKTATGSEPDGPSAQASTPPETSPRPSRPPLMPPTEVVFPLPAAPDDPGPEPEPKPRGFRLFS
jgi:HemY protein